MNADVLEKAALEPPVRREIARHNPDVVHAGGYRIRTPRGIRFLTWATERPTSVG